MQRCANLLMIVYVAACYSMQMCRPGKTLWAADVNIFGWRKLCNCVSVKPHEDNTNEFPSRAWLFSPHPRKLCKFI